MKIEFYATKTLLILTWKYIGKYLLLKIILYLIFSLLILLCN